jgi:hypothetical protein
MRLKSLSLTNPLNLNMVNWVLTLVHTKPSGVVTFPEVLADQDALLSDPNFDSAFDQLIDNTKAVSFAFSSAEVEVIARRKLFFPSSRRAFVAATPSMYWVGRLMAFYQESTMGRDISRIFKDVESAFAWLRENRRKDALGAGSSD